jgi:hypothetical protein
MTAASPIILHHFDQSPFSEKVRIDPNGRKPGDRVEAMPDDYGKIKVSGEIVALSSQHIAIRRHDPRAGEVVVHFPRAGFLVLPV